MIGPKQLNPTLKGDDADEESVFYGPFLQDYNHVKHLLGGEFKNFN
jgi:hypothetical protein